MHLVSVKIHRYKGLAAGTELVFGAGPVFLLGKNGAGKTTLLELLAALVRYDFAWLEKQGELDVEWEAAWPAVPWDGEGEAPAGFGPFSIVCRVRCQPGPDPSAQEVRGGLLFAEPPPAPLTVRIKVIGFGATMAVTAESGRPPEAVVDRAVGPEASVERLVGTDPNPQPFRPDAGVFRLVGSLLPQCFNPPPPAVSAAGPRLFPEVIASQSPGVQRFDEALELLSAVVLGAEVGEDLGPWFQTEKDGRVSGVAGPVLPLRARRRPGSAFREERWWPAAGIRASESSGLLARLPGALGAADIRVQARALRRLKGGHTTWSGFDVEVEWPDGTADRVDRLSFGQKRLLSFCWYVDAMPDGPLFVDELTNGLHYDWVQMLVEALDGRQVFHAVQNPLLLDFTGPGAEGEVAGRFVLCGVEVGPEGRKWTWRNPTPEEAARLFRACAVGIQSVSEVLWSQGLW